MASNPLCPSPSLSSLPVEILTLIVLRLDRNSAISLARVARIFAPIADHRIYRELDLFLPPHWGEYPHVLPNAARSSDGAYIRWAEAEGKRAEERRSKGLREKVNGILRRAGERRLGMVKSVVVVPRPGAIAATLSLLDNISHNLENLRLEARREFWPGPLGSRRQRDSLDIKLIDYDLSLSSLTHLHMTRNSALYAETAITLCRAAPNLTSLEAEFYAMPRIPDWDDELLPRPPGDDTVLSMPKLLRIKMCIMGRDRVGVKHPLVAILRGSPAVKQFYLRCCSGDDELHRNLIQLLGERQELRDLYISISPPEFLRYSSGKNRATGFPSLRRLVLRSFDPTDIYERCIALPRLERLHIERPDDPVVLPLGPPVLAESTASPFTMLPRLSADLRNAPRLTTINVIDTVDFGDDLFANLDVLEGGGNLTGSVRSFVNRGAELLHLRLLTPYEEVADYRFLGTIGGDCGIHYTAKDESKRTRWFVWQDEAESYDWIEIDGCKVPLEIVRQMRKVQGASVQNWQGRGINVGDKAWKVLTDWREKAEEAE